MKPLRKNLRTDLAFLLLLGLLFAFCVFFLEQPYRMENFLLAAAVLIVVLIAYFTNLTVGLAVNAALILLYGAYVVFQSLTRGVAVRSHVYFWLVMSPALTTAFSLFTMSSADLQARTIELEQRLEASATLHEDTKLKNLRAFEHDAHIYQSIARRYGLDLGVLTICFQYEKELERLSHREGMRRVVLRVAETVRAATRAEDELYQLDGDEITFALLLLTKQEGGVALRARIREQIAQIDTNDILNTRQLVLDMRLGLAFDDGTGNALELLAAAKDTMQYDV